MTLTRNLYAARRVLSRMKNRGEPMILRHVSLVSGPVPFRNPPDISPNLAVVAANQITGQDYLNLAGHTGVGRLVPGDKIVCAPSPPVPGTTWTVQTMPMTIATDTDGVPQVDIAGAPIVGAPLLYRPDAVAWDNVFPVVPVVFAHGPVMEGINVTIDILGTLTVDGGGLTAEGFAAADVVTIAGALAPNDDINGVPLTIASLTDSIITTGSLPGGLVDGVIANVTLTRTSADAGDLASTIGATVSAIFAADETVYGNPLTYQQMTELGWVELDTIGLSIAGHGITAPPKVNDLILIGAGRDKRSILQLGRRYSNDIQFLYYVQAR